MKNTKVLRFPISVQASGELELVPPPIDLDFQDVLREEGAQLSDEGEAITYGNDEEAIEAALTSAAVFDMSHFGRIRVTGNDRIRFLHNQSTANFEALKPGQGCDTVFVSPTARTIDLATALVMETSIILTVSPSKRRELPTMLDRYIFFADKVEISDITDRTSQLALIGPRADEIMESLGLGELIEKPYGSHAHFSLQGSPVTGAVGSGVAEKGYQLLLAPEVAAVVWTLLVEKGAVRMGSQAWESLRILQGRPAPGKELTDKINPLEAGLWKSISTSKGCYIGQETIARLITYDGVKQHLWGMRLTGRASVGDAVTLQGNKVGFLTSYTLIKGEHWGLGYMKKQINEPGVIVHIGEVQGELVESPYLTWTLPQ